MAFNMLTVSTPQREACDMNLTIEVGQDMSLQQLIEENKHNERHLVDCKVEEISIKSPKGGIQSLLNSHKSANPDKMGKIDVAVQCEPVSIFEEILSRLATRLLSFITGCTVLNFLVKRIYNWLMSIINNLKISKCTPCACNTQIIDETVESIKESLQIPQTAEYDEKLMKLTAEIKLLKAQVDDLRSIMLNISGPKLNSVPFPPVLPTPPAPPPPPPPPPPPTLFLNTPMIPRITKTKPVEQEVTSVRPIITTEALLSVKLKKVTDRAPGSIVNNGSGGPLVTMDQLRSVKLRSRRRHPSHLTSPTRTPLCRDHVFKQSRSPSFRKEIRPRLDRIPLSAILNMDMDYA